MIPDVRVDTETNRTNAAKLGTQSPRKVSRANKLASLVTTWRERLIPKKLGKAVSLQVGDFRSGRGV